MGEGNQTQVSVLADKNVKRRAKENTEHGEISKHIRGVLSALAEGSDYSIDAGEATIAPEEKYDQLDGGDRPSDWNGRRRDVLRRDDYMCRNCLARGGRDGPAELAVHHIVPAHAGGTHHLTNLVTLCSDCHDLAHNSF